MKTEIFKTNEAVANYCGAMEADTISKNGRNSKSQKSRGNFLLLFIAAFCFSIANTFAQDIITLKNGDDIQALVQEIGEVEVKYKKFDNPNGPNYVLKKAEIFMIRYANGSRDVFVENAAPIVNVAPTPVTAQPSGQSKAEELYVNFWGVIKYRSNNKRVTRPENLFYDTPEALKKFHSARTWSAVGGGFSGGGGALIGYAIGYGIVSGWEEDLNYSAFLWTGFGLSCVGTILSSVAGSKIRTAVDLYNASVRRQQTADITLNLGITPSGGFGLTLNF